MSSNKINPADRYAPADFFVKQTFQTQIIKIIIHHACLLVDTVLVKRKLAYNWDHTFSRISGRQR